MGRPFDSFQVFSKLSQVSFDDKDTFQQKVKYANGLGLGGLMIWAIDQDTDALDALQAVIYPETLNAFDTGPSSASYWQDATMGQCKPDPQLYAKFV